MNYIILDLEWDSAFHKKYKRFVNQILQIGAVKLDNKFNITDSFEITVKSSIAKKVSNRFADLTNRGNTRQFSADGSLLPEKRLQPSDEASSKAKIRITCFAHSTNSHKWFCAAQSR